MLKILKFYFLIAILFVIGCSKEESQGTVPAALKIVTLSTQGYQLTLLPKDIVVRVEDSEGMPMSGIEMELKLDDPKGQIEESSTASDENGEYIIKWRLGTAINQKLDVNVKGHPDLALQFSVNVLYKYNTPESIEDGWEIGNLETLSNVRPNSIFQVIDDIRYQRLKDIHSFLLVKDGKLILEEYFPGKDSNGQFWNFDRSTPHEQQSASKSFRSALIGLAIDNGYIENTDVKIFSYFPELTDWAKNGKEDITLEHLLTMSSGLEWNEWTNPPNDLTQMYGTSANQWHEFVLLKPLSFTPGSTFVYNTGASIMLNRILERATESSLATFTRRFFMNPTESVLLGNNSNLQAKKLPRDMAKLGQVYLNDGKWKDTQVISKEWVDKSLEPAFRVPKVGADYGYQWWIREFTTGTKKYTCHYASGNGGQFIMIIKELNLVAVFTGGNFSGNLGPLSFMGNRILPAFE